MARKYATRIDVTGKSIQDIMSDPSIYSLQEGPTRQIARRLISAANKRLRSFAKAGIYSPSASKVGGLSDILKRSMKDGVAITAGFEEFEEEAKERLQKGFSIADLNTVNEVRREIRRVIDFLKSEDSTVREWRKQRKEATERIKEMGIHMSEDEFDKVMRIYGLLKEMDPSYGVKSLWKVSDRIIAMVKKAVKGDYGKKITFDEIFKRAHRMMEDFYNELRRTEYSGTGDMFDEGVDPGSGFWT